MDRRRAADAVIRDAVPGDLPAILGLLADASLPTVEVERWLENFVVAEVNGRIDGVAGLEIHNRDGILRSVAVRESQRGSGLGATLTRAILDAAHRRRLRSVYLLTTTADDYFPRYGFERIDRADVSRDVQASVEFREACPASATVMLKAL